MNFIQRLYSINGKKRVITMISLFLTLLLIQFLSINKNNMLSATLELIFYTTGLAIAVIIHNLGHLICAATLGDPLPGSSKRLSLNPKHHFDLFGTICFFITGLGWGKMNEIFSKQLKKPIFYSIIIIISGPLANFFAGLGLSLGTIYFFNSYKYLQLGNYAIFFTLSLNFLKALTQANFIIFILNLLPLPPFDAGRLFIMFLQRASNRVNQIESGLNLWITALVFAFTDLPRIIVFMGTSFSSDILRALAY